MVHAKVWNKGNLLGRDCITLAGKLNGHVSFQCIMAM